MSTLGAIRGNVRRNLGEATASATGFYTDAELNQLIGEAYKKYSLYMLEQGAGWFQTTTNVGFTANVDNIDLSVLTPPFHSVAVLYRNTTTAQIVMKESRTRSGAIPLTGVTSGDSYVPLYDFRGLSLILKPTPISSEAGSTTTGLRLDYNYIPTFPVYNSADGFTFDAGFPVIYEPLIELYATIGALENKDGMGGVSDINSFRGRLAQWEERLSTSLEKTEAPQYVTYSGPDYNNWF